MNVPYRLRGSACGVFFCNLFLLGLAVVPAGLAQLPHLDPVPWLAPGDSLSGRSLLLQWDRFDDERFHWQANRLGLTGLLSTGNRSRIFFRMHYLAFTAGDSSSLARWPHLVGEDADEDWPAESQLVGWGRPEVGLVTQLGLPLLGWTQCAIALGLPVGRDQLYPFSAASVPVRLYLRKELRLTGGWHLGLVAGRILHLDSGRDFLDPAAFPSGHDLVVDLRWQYAAGRALTWWLSEERAGDGRSTRLGCQFWIPSGSRASFVLGCQREVAGYIDRPFATQISLGWQLTGAPAKDETGATR